MRKANRSPMAEAGGIGKFRAPTGKKDREGHKQQGQQRTSKFKQTVLWCKMKALESSCQL
jgi:hypothetical protein